LIKANEAFYFWHKARFEGYINEPLDLFHIDAHSDMGAADTFKKSLYFPDNPPHGYLEYYRDFALNELGIADFIRPTILNGIVKNVYFIYPDWRNFKAKRKRLNISSVFGEGKSLKYGLGINGKTDRRVFKAYPDLKWFNYSMQEIDKIPKKRKVILDIDFDYFACVDSASNSLNYELGITREQFDRRDSLLADKRLPYSGFDFTFIERDNKYYAKIAHKKVKDVSHLPPKEEVESEINNLVDVLRTKKIKPRIITMCRSCHSGYCPAEYHAFLERALNRELETL
jgi:hypothetical protein